MGIDIRDGQQLECITCALCIDACDDVMDKLGRPRGLIAYTTLRDYNAHAAEQPRPPAAPRRRRTRRSITISHIARPRTLLYSGLWSLVGLVMLVSLLDPRPPRHQRAPRPQPALRDACRRLDTLTRDEPVRDGDRRPSRLLRRVDLAALLPAGRPHLDHRMRDVARSPPRGSCRCRPQCHPDRGGRNVAYVPIGVASR